MGISVVEFTQLKFPDARPVTITMARPAAICRKQQALKEQGFIFEIECGRDQTIWMTCRHVESELVHDEFCTNGPEIVEKVDSLIENAFKRFYKEKTV